MPRTVFDALNERRKVLLQKLATENVRNNPRKLRSVAHELREISLRLETFEPKNP